MNRAEYADGRRNTRPSPNPESGVALIEFAFVLPILLVLLRSCSVPLLVRYSPPCKLPLALIRAIVALPGTLVRRR